MLASPPLGSGGGSFASSANQSCFRLLRVTLSASERCAHDMQVWLWVHTQTHILMDIHVHTQTHVLMDIQCTH